MSGLVLLVAGGIWLFLGYLLWRYLLAPFLKSEETRVLLGIALVAVWLFAPWADEWLGAREFKRLCDEMPEVKFYGPVSVGPGLLFDEQGRRQLWAQREIEGGLSPFPKGDTKRAHAEGSKFQEAWRIEFKSTTTTQRIQNWPTPVLEETITYAQGSTGRVVLVSHWRGSPGGWIKRVTGWGNHAPHQCSKNETWPQEWNWIKY